RKLLFERRDLRSREVLRLRNVGRAKRQSGGQRQTRQGVELEHQKAFRRRAHGQPASA
ncbi:MAG: hypothetical protein RJB60_91, partial [Pseudomonadota bacterium]